MNKSLLSGFKRLRGPRSILSCIAVLGALSLQAQEASFTIENTGSIAPNAVSIASAYGTGWYSWGPDSIQPGQSVSNLIAANDYYVVGWQDASGQPIKRTGIKWVGYGHIDFTITPAPRINDNNDHPPPPGVPPLPGSNPPGSGDGNPPCGMPVWRVAEPYINLWIDDEPLGYQPSLGSRLSFTLGYQNRETLAGYNPFLTGAGKKWNFSWLSYVEKSGTNYMVYYPGGGSRTYTNGVTDVLTNSRLSGDTTNGFTLTFPDGSAYVYGFIVTNNFNVFQKAMASDLKNPLDQKTRLNYYSYNPTNVLIVRLKSVIDGDGRTNTIYYNATNAYSTNLISQVVDAFGRTNSLAYDSSGRLTNIVDVAGLSSTFSYDSSDVITSMITPYGTNIFEISIDTTNAPNGRYVLVTEPNGSKQLFLYTNSAPGIAASYPTNQVPNTNPSTNGFENSELDTRNSFHWNRSQYAALSTTNIGALATNDFAKAHMKHWLRATTNSVSESLSLERAASQDGTNAGHLTWYDYAGKTNANYVGTQVQPLFVAHVLPDAANTWYLRTDRNTLSHSLTNTSTYSVGSTLYLRTNTFTYATNDTDLVKVIRKNGAVDEQVSSNYFNTYHLVLTNYNALNELTTYDYNTNQQMIRVKFPNGLMTTNIFDTNNLLTTTIDFTTTENLRTNTFTYTNNLVYTVTDPRGLTITNTWDPLQRLRQVKFPDGTYITNGYDRLDLIHTIDRMGNTNLLAYNSMRQLVASTNAVGTVTGYKYCECGALESVTNAVSVSGIEQVTRYVYDNQGNPITVFNADGTTAANLYDSLGRLTNVTDSFGTSVTNHYNNQGLLVAVTNNFGRVMTRTFDFADRATNNVDANGVSIDTTYDVQGRVLTRTFSDTGLEKFVYTTNVVGTTSYTNQLGSNVVNYAYDALGRKTNEVYPAIATNQYAYSAASDLRTLTDGKNQVTSWGYDIYGRTTSKTNQAGTEVLRYQYDASSRLTNRWSAAKTNTVYAYDKVGNLTNVNYSVSPDITLQYDALSRLTNMVDAAGTSTFSYSYANQLLTEDGPWAEDTVIYGYNNQLRSTLMLLQPNASSWVQTYSYDPAKRLTNTVSQAGSFVYAYDATRQIMANKLTLPGGSYITNAFDSVARLSGTWLKNSGNTNLNSHLYGYNLAGQRTALTNIAGNRLDYTYDLIGQLKTAKGYESGGGARLNEQFGYGYDPSGNLNQRTNNALAQTFGVNALNELTNITRSGTLTVAGTTTSAATNVTVNSLTADRYADNTFARTNFSLADGNNSITATAQDSSGRSDTHQVVFNLPATVGFQYDLNGNLTSDGKRGFDYDDDNQLIRVTVTNSWKSEFTYDGKYRRRIRKEFAWIGGAWAATNEVRYVYEGTVVIQERNGSNLPQVTYTRTGGRLLSRTDHTTILPTHAFYHADGNGNITALVKLQQVVVARYQYDPFGNILSKSGPLADANLYRWSSKEHHQASGLYYYGFRFYDPNLQRWLNHDPMGESGGVNLYRFSANDPVNLIDPDGLAPQLISLEFDPRTGQVTSLYGPDYASARAPNKVSPLITLDSARDAIRGILDLPYTLRKKLLPDEVNDFLDDLGEMLDPEPPEGTLQTAAPPLPGLKPCWPRRNLRNAPQRTHAENRQARNKYKNNKDVAREAWEKETGQKWPTDQHGNPWPGEHTPPLKYGGDPMKVTPRDPSAPDPHNIPGPDGLTDYQRWGALGTPAREANKK
jgi:RHS repeat-associated protein